MAALLALVGSGVALQLLYSSLPYLIPTPVTDSDQGDALLTQAERTNPPRVAKRVLPSGIMLNKFRRDGYTTVYHDPNYTNIATINTDAVLPVGFNEAYRQRISDAMMVRVPGAGGPMNQLDPNLRIGRYQSPQVYLLQADLRPNRPWSESSKVHRVRSPAGPLRAPNGLQRPLNVRSRLPN